jgi:hypothetical protein
MGQGLPKPALEVLQLEIWNIIPKIPDSEL